MRYNFIIIIATFFSMPVLADGPTEPVNWNGGVPRIILARTNLGPNAGVKITCRPCDRHGNITPGMSLNREAANYMKCDFTFLSVRQDKVKDKSVIAKCLRECGKHEDNLKKELKKVSHSYDSDCKQFEDWAYKTTTGYSYTPKTACRREKERLDEMLASETFCQDLCKMSSNKCRIVSEFSEGEIFIKVRRGAWAKESDLLNLKQFETIFWQNSDKPNIGWWTWGLQKTWKKGNIFKYKEGRVDEYSSYGGNYSLDLSNCDSVVYGML